LTKFWNFPFPGLLISNKNQFDDYRRSHSNLLDYRYALELKLSSTGGKPVRIEGVCPLTQMHTAFVSTVPAGDKRVTPDWREQQFDDRGVGMSDRAVAHFALYDAPDMGLGRTALVSTRDVLLPILRSRCTSLDYISLPDLWASDKSWDTILVSGQLEHQRDIHAALRAMHSRLTEGGNVYIHCSLHYGETESVLHDLGGRPYWALAWDLMDIFRDSGFANPQAVTFWSQELGYLGPSNLVFFARK